nr:F-box/FBD/LRR-repeat protein At5g44980-like [Ipomoea batatas]
MLEFLCRRSSPVISTPPITNNRHSLSSEEVAMPVGTAGQRTREGTTGGSPSAHTILMEYAARLLASLAMATDGKKNKTDESIDYISRLPESVIHHILSFLPFRRIVRTSVLSKTWNRFWSNYPNVDLTLDFGLYDCPRPQFLSIFERIMDQCLFRKDCIQKLDLDINFPVLEELVPFLDRSLGAATVRNVSELVIKLHCREEGDGPYCFYSIPQEVFTGSLKVLDIERCKFEGCHAWIKLPCLQQFKLNCCKFLGENLLNKILCGCPELEFLDVSFCEGVVHCLSVLSKPRLKYFKVFHLKEPARIEVFAPSLETFKCSLLKPCAIDLAGCTVLKYLKLDGADLSADYVPLQDLLSKFHYIEELELGNCIVADKIEISSSCLKKLVIIDYINFPGAEIDIPNLLHLDFLVTGFLMKLHKYENLKLLIACKGLELEKFIVLEKLHAVSFSSLNTVLKKTMPEFIVISSRRVEDILGHMLYPINSSISVSLIFSSRQSIELLYRNLSSDKTVKFPCRDFQLVSTAEIEHEMDSAWKSFMKMHSTEWRTWKQLKREETGLGWDPSTHKISGSDEWWEKKIKENSEYKKIRNKSIDPAMEIAMQMVKDNQHSSQLHDLEVDESSFWNNFMSEVNHCVGNQDVSGTQLMYKNLSKAEKLQSSFNTFELVPTQERLSEMDSAWKSFINTHSTGYNNHGSKVGTVGWTTEYGWELDGLK